MRALLDMDTIQIEVTNFCPHECANCTRFCSHFEKHYFMEFEDFKKAVDSMVNYPKMTGIMGGEPLLHPDFEKMCNYLHSKIPPMQCGLWTCFPKGKEHYREVIVETFSHIFLNDHTRDDVIHHPFLVSAKEIQMDEWLKWYMIDHCFYQHSWSASINPHGAFFCEIAASLSMLLNIDGGWPMENGWWRKCPKDFISQMEKYCLLCGGSMALKKRHSVENADDISPEMYERLKETSPKIKKGQYAIHDLKLCQDDRQMASYKDEIYRNKIADRYGMFLMLNDMRFMSPYLKRKWKGGDTYVNQDNGTSEQESRDQGRQCSASIQDG